MIGRDEHDADAALWRAVFNLLSHLSPDNRPAVTPLFTDQQQGRAGA